jgi:hypothetical protein
MITNRRPPVVVSALVVAALAVAAVACGGDGGQPAASTAPAATGTPGEAVFPVILEHDTQVTAAADGSDIREQPVPYQPRVEFEGIPSRDGLLRASFHDGTLFVQEGDGELVAIAEVPSTAEFANIGWSPDGERLVFESRSMAAPPASTS